MAFKFIMYLFCRNTSKNRPLVRLSSRLRFGCHGWVHWLSSPQSFLKRREGWTIIHFCTHSFHSPEPARPADVALSESGSPLTQQCAALRTRPECVLWNAPDAWHPVSVREPGKNRTLKSTEENLSFCISEDSSKRLMEEKWTVSKLRLRNDVTSWKGETYPRVRRMFLLLAENPTYN